MGILMFFFCCLSLIFAQEDSKIWCDSDPYCEEKFDGDAIKNEHLDPYSYLGSVFDNAERIGTSRAIEQQINIWIENKDRTKDAISCLVIAELYKRLDNPQAECYYLQAIKYDQANPEIDDPIYELYYADYLRNFRGPPSRPLFYDAEKYYWEGIKKFEKLDGSEKKRKRYAKTGRRLQRGIIALYQEDGFPLLRQADDCNRR